MLTFYIVDVFAESKYSGNQLAVVIGAEGLSGLVMQKIAKEINYSETTFVLSKEEQGGGYDVRIFTPEREVPFAGHPTLGTAYVIQHEIVKAAVDKIVLNLKAGKIPVSFNHNGKQRGILWMKQLQPVFGQNLDIKSISQVLGLNSEDLDSRFPIQEVSTGLPFIIAPLKSLDALKRARTIKEKYFELIKNIQAKAILIFCPETHKKGKNLSVRVFADYYGVAEDPATGSANGCLAAYLAKHRYFGGGRVEARVEQGYEIGRPSLLLLKAEDRQGKIDVQVGGRVIMIAKGKFL